MGAAADEQDSSSPCLTLVVAVADNGVIGRGGDLPWRLPADLAHFKRLTLGHALIMGRKTYESIGRPLPGRASVVLTRDPTYRVDHSSVHVATRLSEAITAASTAEVDDSSVTFVIGGGEVYRLALPHAERVHLTRVHTTVDGDATFPDLNAEDWRRVSTQDRPADTENEHACTFEIWERVTE